MVCGRNGRLANFEGDRLLLKFTGVSVDVAHNEERRDILRGINLELEAGHMYALTGPNGGGKSTLARAMTGMIPLQKGTISWNGKNLTGMSVDERARLGIRYAFQQPPRFKGLTVRRLMQLAAVEVDEVKTFRTLRQVGLCPEQYINRPVDATLSGGEIRRLEIAQLLVSRAELLIFDEPEAGVDLWTFDRLLELIGNLHKRGPGCLTLVITHNEHFLRRADRVIVLAEGEVQRQGSPEEIIPEMTEEFACQWRQACGGAEVDVDINGTRVAK